MEGIQFINTTPDQLKAEIADVVRTVVKEISKSPEPVELLTREEAAGFLKVSLTTLNNWKNAGKIQAYGMGNCVYYYRSELMAALIKLNQVK